MPDESFFAFIPIHRYNTTTFIRNPVRIFDMDWYYSLFNNRRLTQKDKWITLSDIIASSSYDKKASDSQKGG